MFWETCSESQLLQVYNDYNITEKSLRNDVEYLLEWMKQEPHLPNVPDPELLVTAIFVTRNNIKKTKRLLECYYMMKAIIPQAFLDRNIPKSDVDFILRNIVVAPLPKLTPEGFRVWITQLGKTEDDLSLFSIDTLMKWAATLFDLILKYDRHRGFIVVVNSENLSGAHIALALSLVKSPLIRCGKLLPNILEKIYVVNFPSIAMPLLPIVMKIYRKSVTKKIEIWKGNAQDLVQVLPADILPPNYGGAGPTVEELKNQLYDYVMQHKHTLMDDHTKADLTKWPQNCKQESAFSELGYGVPGSFRNISIE